MCIQSSCTTVYNLALDRGRLSLQKSNYLDSLIAACPAICKRGKLFFSPDGKDCSIRFYNHIICSTQNVRIYVVDANVIYIVFNIILNRAAHPFKNTAFRIFKPIGNSFFTCDCSRFPVGDSSVIFIRLKILVLNIIGIVFNSKIACIFRSG